MHVLDTLVVTPRSYPAELERTVALRNGARVRLRPIRPADEPRLVELYERLSAVTAYRRFFTLMETLPPELAHHFANVDYHRRLALVACSPATRTLRGGACSSMESRSSSSVANVVRLEE